MRNITIDTPKQLGALINKDRKNIVQINGIDFKELYPMLESTNNYVSYYDADRQDYILLSKPYNVLIKE